MNGFVKIHRSILGWEWWDDVPVRLLWITILLEANWKEKKWHGMTIPRGSFWTSLPSLAAKTGLSVQQTRTALEKLKSTGEVTCRATRRGQLITVENYDFFQANENPPTYGATYRATDNQHAINMQSNMLSTSTEEYKEIKKERRGRSAPSSSTDIIRELIEEMDDD